MKKIKAFLAMVLAVLMITGTVSAAFAVNTTDENEENGTPATATEFSVSDKARGAITNLNDIDYFKVTVSKADVYSVEFTHTSNDSSSVLFNAAILKSDGVTNITSFAVKGNEAAVSSPEFSAKENDVFYIKITPGSVADGSIEYGIQMKSATVSGISGNLLKPEIESNDIMPDATEMDSKDITKGFTSWYHGAIAEKDTDWYYMPVKTSGYVQMYLKNSQYKKGAYRAELCYLKGTGEDLTVIGMITLTETSDEVYSADIGLKAGSYYIKVVGADSSSTGGYLLRAYIEQDIQTETEYNDTIESANALSIGTKKYAATAVKDDIDYFKITANKDCKVTVSTVADGRNDGSGNWTAELRDSKDKSLATYTVNKDNTVTFDFTDKTGTYYIRVKAGSNYTTGLYQIESASAAPAEEDPGEMSFIDRIKAIKWNEFWQGNSFPELLSIILDGNGGFYKILWNLLQLSFGTIIKYFTNR